jgi:hypothetical protein
VELHQDNPIAILNIAKGLTTTIHRRKEQNMLATLAFAHKISNLKRRLDTYQNMVPLLTSDRPKGYVINDDTRVLDFIIPIGDGERQQAYWVKQLAEGQVVGLPQEYIPGQTPFVTEVYTSPVPGQEDVMGPVHIMPHWLYSLLVGPAAHFGMLLKHVKTVND